ncbi:NF-kappa-B inhibitor epsilon [Pelobates fuscus]|uniref:NF-kappa-B inhibitor epsilon n=1 Tax=Pelobates fuscus TaxID=191477 RepID=UPI002FE494DC
MSEEWNQKKLSLQPEEGRYDSGIADSVQSLGDDGVSRLHSLLEEGDGKHHGVRSQVPVTVEDKLPEIYELERIDSTYGSSSLIESISASCVSQSTPTERPALQEVRKLDPQQLDALIYVSEDGDTLLHLAIIHSMPDIALYFTSLVTKDILDIQNDLYQTALHLAVYLDQRRVVEALVFKGANGELQDRKGDTALHVACDNQHLECARIVLQGLRGQLNMHLQNWNGLSCIHVATLKRDRALISLLLESGADINDQEGTSGKTPLHLAVEIADCSLVTELLSYRPCVNATMYNGCTPLHLAVGRKDAALARLLCQAGADTLIRNREGDTPHDLAEGNNQLLALLPFDDLKISGQPVVTSA